VKIEEGQDIACSGGQRAYLEDQDLANFSDFEIETGDNLVVVGENKVGKSNLIFALQLILDPGLSERDRQSGLEHFWDGLGDDKLGAVIEIAIELTDFEDDPRLLAHLGDCIVDRGPDGIAAHLPFPTQGRIGRRASKHCRLRVHRLRRPRSRQCDPPGTATHAAVGCARRPARCREGSGDLATFTASAAD
jgi:energy-coupling factor transporter ATP-binding protein EcfA2